MSVLVYAITKDISSFQKFGIKKNFIQEVLERSLTNFLEEIDKREIKSCHFRRNVSVLSRVQRGRRRVQSGRWLR